MADYIQADNRELIITTNKVAVISDLNIIENYIKNINVVDSNEVMFPRFVQSKSYLKILGIFYHIKDIYLSITSDIVEKVLYPTHNIVFTS